MLSPGLDPGSKHDQTDVAFHGHMEHHVFCFRFRAAGKRMLFRMSR
jgi:hypothetical protein